LIIFLVLYVISRAYRKINAQDIKGKVVLITGGGSGIGRGMALSFAKNGCKVVIWDINEEGLKKVEKEIKDTGGEVWMYKCNVMSYANVKEIVSKVKSEVGKIDILIHNAGIVSGKFLLELSEENITRTFNVNTISHYWTLKEILPDMLSSNSGHIVTIASASAISATTGLVDYSASKYAAFGTNEALRLELRKQKATGINTTVVCPYYINTGMFDGVKTKYPFLLPILEEKYVVNRIVDSVIHKDYMLIMPEICRVSWLAKFMFPISFSDWMLDQLGITDSMAEFKGRGWQSTDPEKSKTSKKE